MTGICTYKLGTTSGLECKCEECKSIRRIIVDGEKKGKLKIIATKKEKKLLRK